jgi:hypothetical protein
MLDQKGKRVDIVTDVNHTFRPKTQLGPGDTDNYEGYPIRVSVGTVTGAQLSGGGVRVIAEIQFGRKEVGGKSG